MRLLFIYVLLVQSFVFANPILQRLQYGRDWTYQDILINGEVIYKSSNISGGTENVNARYLAIKTILDQYKRPIKVLDLGANNGFFSLKIAQEYDSVVVMIDGMERLTDICMLNTQRDNIIHLQKYFNHRDISDMLQDEHFDVILALHVLHHVDYWSLWLDTLFKLGDNIIIETPSENDAINKFEHTKQLARYLLSLPNAIPIGSFPRGVGANDYMLWFCQNPNFQNIQDSPIGIKPNTFFKFNGRFPTQSYVTELGEKIRYTHGSKQWLLKGLNYSLQ